MYKRMGIFFILEHLAICVMAYMFRRNQVCILGCPPFSLKTRLRVELNSTTQKRLLILDWLQDYDGNSCSKHANEQQRLAQHWLIADQLYPQLETDNTFNFAVAHRFGSKWMRRVRQQHRSTTIIGRLA